MKKPSPSLFFLMFNKIFKTIFSFYVFLHCRGLNSEIFVWNTKKLRRWRGPIQTSQKCRILFRARKMLESGFRSTEIINNILNSIFASNSSITE